MNPNIPIDTLTYYDKGQSVTDFLPGDFLLIAEDTFLAKLITLGQSLRFGRQFAKWNHCALISDQNGSLIEATSKGINQTTLAKYTDKPYYHIRIKALENDRFEACAFARACIGEKYGIFTFLSIAWSALTGSKFAIGIDGQEVCSGLVARSLERTAAIFPVDGSHVSPALLAQLYLPNQT